MFVLCSSIVTTDEEEQGEIKSSWYHSGASFIMSPSMEILAKVDLHKEGIAVADLDLSLLDTARIEWNPYGKEARDEIFL